jgi:competence ComEA-like helix-hairpin-helix protein
MRKSQLIIVITLLIASLCSAAFAADEAAAAPSGVVNINTADAGQLARLPGVGLKAAQRIIEYRTEHGAFAKATDLMQVKGFGDKTFERLSSYIAVKGDTTLSAKVQGPRKPRAKASKQQPANTASK